VPLAAGVALLAGAVVGAVAAVPLAVGAAGALPLSPWLQAASASRVAHRIGRRLSMVTSG
ncbi:MAG: MFS transporter, partial [Frateuria sp.]|nr:MFS transporter [Frateuria sp.]